MAALDFSLFIKNLTGILDEFLENYSTWNTLSEYEQLDFDTEWCNAVGQYEALRKELLSSEQTQQLNVITRKLKEIKPTLMELNLLVPEGI